MGVMDVFVGWRILICDPNHVIHLVGSPELHGSTSQDTPILPEKSFMLGGQVVSVCGVSSSAFLAAFPQQICHISLS